MSISSLMINTIKCTYCACTQYSRHFRYHSQNTVRGNLFRLTDQILQKTYRLKDIAVYIHVCTIGRSNCCCYSLANIRIQEKSSLNYSFSNIMYCIQSMKTISKTKLWSSIFLLYVLASNSLCSSLFPIPLNYLCNQDESFRGSVCHWRNSPPVL